MNARFTGGGPLNGECHEIPPCSSYYVAEFPKLMLDAPESPEDTVMVRQHEYVLDLHYQSLTDNVYYFRYRGLTC